MALFNARGEVFVGERIDTPGAWQMPQGGIDDGEDIETAARRELLEEVGCDHIEVLRIADKTVRYDVPENLRQQLWNGQYRGQEQFWVAARFLGADNDIDIEHHPIPEFRQWKWVKLENTVELIVPFKRKVYEEVIDMFRDIPDSL